VRGKPEPTLDAHVSSQKPFGLRTYFHGAPTKKGIRRPIKLYGAQKISWIDRSVIERNDAWVNEWKVLLSAVQGTSSAVETRFLSNPIIAGPGEACTETYLVAGHFSSERAAKRYATYLRTRFARFLVSLRKAAQHVSRDTFAFIPDVPLTRNWTDAELYKRYGLTMEEIAFIEDTVAPMEPRDD
jgi:site-specific DNA-methyltransferase (adenine-specific)